MRSVLQVVGLAVLLGVAGCAAVSEAPVPPAGRKAGAKTQTVEVAEVRQAALEAALDEQKGTVVLVDFWATWCGPCVKKFPKFVELHTKYADQGLTCVSVSMDRLSGQVPTEKVHDFLKAKNATFPNFIAADPKADDGPMAKKFGPVESIPYMVLFDRSGKRAWTSDDIPPGLSEEQRAEAVEKRVKEELAK